MIIKNGTDQKIEKRKAVFGITGDVYVVGPGNYMESLESHRRLYPESTATTIEEAETERILFMEREEIERRLAAEEEAARLEAEEEDSDAEYQEGDDE